MGRSPHGFDFSRFSSEISLRVPAEFLIHVKHVQSSPCREGISPNPEPRLPQRSKEFAGRSAHLSTKLSTAIST